jgi:hypothetical protein
MKKKGRDDGTVAILVLQTSLSTTSNHDSSSGSSIGSAGNNNNNNFKSEQEEERAVHAAWQQVVTSTSIHCDVLLYPNAPSAYQQQQQQHQQQVESDSSIDNERSHHRRRRRRQHSRSNNHNNDYPILRFRNEPLHPIGIDNLFYLSNMLMSRIEYILSLADCTMATTIVVAAPASSAMDTGGTTTGDVAAAGNDDADDDALLRNVVVTLPMEPVSSTYRVSWQNKQQPSFKEEEDDHDDSTTSILRSSSNTLNYRHHRPSSKMMNTAAAAAMVVVDDESIVHVKVDFRFLDVAYETFAEAFLKTTSSSAAAAASATKTTATATSLMQQQHDKLENEDSKNGTTGKSLESSSSSSINDRVEPSLLPSSVTDTAEDVVLTLSTTTTETDKAFFLESHAVAPPCKEAHQQQQPQDDDDDLVFMLPSSTSPSFSEHQHDRRDALLHKLEFLVERELQDMNHIISIMMGMAVALLFFVIWTAVQISRATKRRERLPEKHHAPHRHSPIEHHHRQHHYCQQQRDDDWQHSSDSFRSRSNNNNSIVAPSSIMVPSSYAFRDGGDSDDGGHTRRRHLVSPLSMDAVLRDDDAGRSDEIDDYCARSHTDGLVLISAARGDSHNKDDEVNHGNLDDKNQPTTHDKKEAPPPSLQDVARHSLAGSSIAGHDEAAASVQKKEQQHATTNAELSPCSKLALEWSRNKKVRRRHRKAGSSKIVLNPLVFAETTTAITAHTVATPMRVVASSQVAAAASAVVSPTSHQRPVFGLRTSQAINCPPGTADHQTHQQQQSQQQQPHELEQQEAHNLPCSAGVTSSSGMAKKSTPLRRPIRGPLNENTVASITGTSVSITPARRSFAQDYWM